jgi:polysaccharide biosynthesis transport protein
MAFEKREFSLWGKWAILEKRKGLILFCTLACALSAATFSLLQPRIYNATTFLLVSESRITDGDSRNPNYVFYELLRSYETFINNDYLIQKTLERFGLQKLPYSLSVDKFKRRHILQVELSKNTRLLEVNVEFPNAQLAADIANFFAENAVTFNEEMNARDTQRMRFFLKPQLDQASQQLDTSRKNLLEFSKNSRLEELRESVWNLLEEKSQNETELAKLNVSLARLSAKRDGLLAELKGQDPKIELKRSLVEDPLYREDLNSSGNGKAKLPLDTLVKEESVNPIYQQVQSQIVETDSDILGTKAGIQTLQKTLDTNKPRLDLLLQDKALKESTLEQLSQECKLAGENYAVLNKKYQDASLTVSARSTELKVIAPAITPERPIKPRIPLNILLASVLGLLVSTLLVFFLHNLEVARKQTRLNLEESSEDRLREVKRGSKGF